MTTNAGGETPPSRAGTSESELSALGQPEAPQPRKNVRIAILGEDAVSAYMALRLKNPGVVTTLIAPRPGLDSHLAAIRKDGVTLRAKKGEETARLSCPEDPAEAGPQDYVIVTQSDRQAAKTMEPLLGPGTIVVTAQAGMPWWYFYRSGGEFEGGRLESVDPSGELWDQVGPERAVGCVVRIAVVFAEPGVIEHRSGNSIVLGEPSGEKTKRVEALIELLTGGGFNASVTRSIRDEIWNSLWSRLAFDPISVLTASAAAKIGGDAGIRAIAKAMMEEARQAGEALGVKFEGNVEKHIRAAADGNGEPSMLADLKARRDLEIDAVGTAVQEMAQRASLATPTIDMVLALARLRAEAAGLYSPPSSDGPLGKFLDLVGERTRAVWFMAAEVGAQVAGGVAQVGDRIAGVATDLADEFAENVKWAYGRTVPMSKKAASCAVAFVHDTGQGILATGFARELNDMLARLVKGPPTAIDKMMDAEFIKTGIGGGLHRLFDGGHTLWGAFKAARDAPTDDGIPARALGMVLGLFRDVTTPAGLPFFTWDDDTYKRVNSYLEDHFGISKKAFEDLNKYDATDITQGLLGSATLIFHWRDGEAKDFARIVGSTGLAAIVKRNPLLGVVTIAAMVRAVMVARGTESYEECVKKCAEGVLTTAAPMAVVPLVVAAGGPASVALIASVLAGMAVTLAAKKVEDSKAVNDLASQLARLISKAAGEGRKRLPSSTGCKEKPASAE